MKSSIKFCFIQCWSFSGGKKQGPWWNCLRKKSVTVLVTSLNNFKVCQFNYFQMSLRCFLIVCSGFHQAAFIYTFNSGNCQNVLNSLIVSNSFCIKINNLTSTFFHWIKLSIDISSSHVSVKNLQKRIFPLDSIHVKMFVRKKVLTGNLFWWEFILNDPLEKQSIFFRVRNFSNLVIFYLNFYFQKFSTFLKACSSSLRFRNLQFFWQMMEGVDWFSGWK